MFSLQFVEDYDPSKTEKYGKKLTLSRRECFIEVLDTAGELVSVSTVQRLPRFQCCEFILRLLLNLSRVVLVLDNSFFLNFTLLNETYFGKRETSV